MAVKTFTTGEVLTSADTNTYLANSGLVYVTSVPLTSGSLVTVSNCFSSTYDNYRVVASFTRSTVGTAYSFLGLGTTYADHVMSGAYTTWNSPTRTGDNGASAYCAFTAVGQCTSISDIMCPNLSTFSYLNHVGNNADYQSFFNVRVANTTAFTGFRYEVSSGAFTAGTLTVYGYRKA